MKTPAAKAVVLGGPADDDSQVVNLTFPKAGGALPLPKAVKGDEFKVSLPSNPSTGYSWQILEKASNPSTGYSWQILEKDGVQLLSEAHFKDESALGSSGTAVFLFRLTEDPQSENDIVSFIYARPGMKTTAAKAVVIGGNE